LYTPAYPEIAQTHQDHLVLMGFFVDGHKKRGPGKNGGFHQAKFKTEPRPMIAVRTNQGNSRIKRIDLRSTDRRLWYIVRLDTGDNIVVPPRKLLSFRAVQVAALEQINQVIALPRGVSWESLVSEALERGHT
jgi:hypothetical protein